MPNAQELMTEYTEKYSEWIETYEELGYSRYEFLSQRLAEELVQAYAKINMLEKATKAMAVWE